MTSEETTFWISFISIVSGMFVISLKYCLKSKCDIVECGCFRIHRNTNEEPPDSPTRDNSVANLGNIL